MASFHDNTLEKIDGICSDNRMVLEVGWWVKLKLTFYEESMRNTFL